MGKGRKNRKPQPTSAPGTAQRVSAAASPISTPAGGRVPLVQRIALQFAALLGFGTALGFIFNAANPIGVRFDQGGPVAELHTGPATNFTLLSTSTVVAPKPSPVPRPPPFPPLPTTQPAPIPIPTATQSAPPPQPPVATTVVHTPPPVVISNVPPVPAPAVAAVAPTNPAPIHWLEAKQLAAGGQAVLVDVRPRPVYDAGHIPDAVSMPETSTFEELTAFLKLVPSNTTLVVYCASTSCSQSKRVADRLVQQFNYSPVRFMTGGYQEYQQEELAKPQPKP